MKISRALDPSSTPPYYVYNTHTNEEDSLTIKKQPYLEEARALISTEKSSLENLMGLSPLLSQIAFESARNSNRLNEFDSLTPFINCADKSQILFTICQNTLRILGYIDSRLPSSDQKANYVRERLWGALAALTPQSFSDLYPQLTALFSSMTDTENPFIERLEGLKWGALGALTLQSFSELAPQPTTALSGSTTDAENPLDAHAALTSQNLSELYSQLEALSSPITDIESPVSYVKTLESLKQLNKFSSKKNPYISDSDKSEEAILSCLLSSINFKGKNEKFTRQCLSLFIAGCLSIEDNPAQIEDNPAQIGGTDQELTLINERFGKKTLAASDCLFFYSLVLKFHSFNPKKARDILDQEGPELVDFIRMHITDERQDYLLEQLRAVCEIVFQDKSNFFSSLLVTHAQSLKRRPDLSTNRDLLFWLQTISIKIASQNQAEAQVVFNSTKGLEDEFDFHNKFKTEQKFFEFTSALIEKDWEKALCFLTHLQGVEKDKSSSYRIAVLRLIQQADSDFLKKHHENLKDLISSLPPAFQAGPLLSLLEKLYPELSVAEVLSP